MPGAKRKPDRLQGEQREGLSPKAGLASVTMPIQTAAQSLALLGQIRPPDRAAPQLDPTQQWTGQTREIHPKLRQPFPFLALRAFIQLLPKLSAKSLDEPSYLTTC
ncbi:hypothetical protein PBY51_015785 [Eleginops maclovinus]|uniref:Uncharacterized protein n=1 Tax=Eleginops maclovinus TaxID=56733 RepID=A0AAN7XPK2_ELEMC|nr:hypothetical protein PBY51_015785 [Eleginops maclovinus]